MHRWLVLALVAAPLVRAPAQTPADTGAGARDSALRVFFDCPGFGSGCDFDYLRTEITFVNWVRNREDAQVHVLISLLNTGGGGNQYTVTFIGLERFAGSADTLTYSSGPTDTQDDQRRALGHLIKLGLVRFVASTPLAPRVDVSYAAPVTLGPATPSHDPWNSWVFRTSLNGNFFAQQSSNNLGLFSSISANRVTERWKTQLSVNANYNESNFHYRAIVTDSLGDSIGTEGITIGKSVRSFGFDLLQVKSLGPHWSAGVKASGARANFLNESFTIGGGPAVEYDVFPYAQATRRQLTALYEIAPVYFDYNDTTVFFKTQETLVRQTLDIGLSATQPWGSLSFSIEAASYLPKVNQNHLSIFGSGDVRLFRGFSFNFFASASAITDQRNLAKSSPDLNDVLLQRRDLKTSFQYSAFMGVSYTFGSTLNNVVNPRFGGGGGGSIMIMN
ncbi:MAG TPA: hypothetical protein VI160_01210 [Gemmatimonadales bacterium]